MTQQFRLGIVGCGRIANAHALAAVACASADVAALVDPVEERARALAQRAGVHPFIATSVRDLAGRVDGVVVATPNHTHADVAVACLEAGLPTLIEKPLATSVAEGERILRAAATAGCVVTVGYVTRFRENIQLMCRLLRSEHFGRVRRFAYQFGSRGGWAPLSAYNLDRRRTGGGVLVVTGTHFLDRMLDWFGYPDEMELADDSLGGPEANAVARFLFRRNDGEALSGLARFSKTVALEPGLVLDTDAGTVVFPDRRDGPIVVRPHDAAGIETVIRATNEAPRVVNSSEFVTQLEDFIQACRGGSPTVSGEQALISMRLIEALYARRKPLCAAGCAPAPVESPA